MATDTGRDAADRERVEAFGGVVCFSDVFRREVSLVNQRRGTDDPRGHIVLETEASEDTSGHPVLRPNEDACVVGLALSGGGIRSAAFCLGALQALHETRVLRRVDYLSTVSGGGYIGCSLTAALNANSGNFPFTSRIAEDESPSLQHIRDHSNYLFANGVVDVLHNASIYARGLVANAVVILPFLLAAAVLTLVAWNIFGFQRFVITPYLSLLLAVAAIGWGVYRSRNLQQREPEIPSLPAKVVGTLVILVLISAFCELQPYLLNAMLESQTAARGSEPFLAVAAGWIKTISAALAPAAVALAFLRSKVEEFIKSARESPRTRAKIAGYAAKAAVYLAALILPLLLWMIYLEITFWGICINARLPHCAPEWLGNLASGRFGTTGHDATLLYLVIAALFVLITLLLRPNANSLHPLYRDHLAKAFLFKPEQRLIKDRDLQEERPLLSDISAVAGPYHLINAALNVQNSKTANKRGRNADFFLFSSQFVGSKTTGYVATRDMQEIPNGLDLATAMAVSGAAASSSMGAESIKPLTPTLALLNIRLGYWLRNPTRVKEAGPANRSSTSLFSRVRRRHNVFANYYFLLELFGLLNEKLKSVYLTDGGHIENLGVYELLKRRCRVIIVIDAVADQEMAFGSLNTMERYARIDLGVRIDLPWQELTNVARKISKTIDDTGDCPKLAGPHCAIGEIEYPGNRRGVLIYVKSSLTGDENDYIFHYKRRYSQFPHETTLDQMFSEEQFEAYRALGFHAVYNLFDRSDRFAHLDPAKRPHTRAQIALLDHLFPRVSTDAEPGQRQRFAEWLAADPLGAA
jgi:predicted acylesterase/phospholipase RssA